MIAKIKINHFMHKLLIEMNMDGFSVTEARDAILSSCSEHNDVNQVRLMIYRQILSFLDKGWLRSAGEGRHKQYWVTDTFRQLSVISKNCVKSNDAKEVEDAKLLNIRNKLIDQLAKEKKQYEGELSIALGEVEQLLSLIERFPQKANAWTPLLVEAKEHSAALLGRINALGKVLDYDEKATS